MCYFRQNGILILFSIEWLNNISPIPTHHDKSQTNTGSHRAIIII